jgi:hypothetical protein
LENTNATEQFLILPGSKQLDYEISCTHQIALLCGPANVDEVVSCPLSMRCLSLPLITEAIVFFDHYTKHIDPIQHVIYIPTVRRILDDVYSKVDRRQHVIPGHAALLLAIFASAAALLSRNTIDETQPFSPKDAHAASLYWINAVFELLDFSSRMAAASLEDCQAMIITAFLLFHTQGFSARARTLFASAVTVTREMSLHRLDEPKMRPTSLTVTESAEMEIKRRVFWHVVASDWSLAASGGPQEGTYLIHPGHFNVRPIRNVDDEDLLRDPPVDLPLSQPTTMSYYIQRVKLAELGRTMVDTIPLFHADPLTINYQDVIDMDEKFEAFFADIPPFLRTDERSIRDSKSIRAKYPHLGLQSHALSMIANTRRCKLHQPFLIRGSIDPRYTYSRAVSLKSARAAMDCTKRAINEVGSTVQKTGVISHLFLAYIVLVMDLCFNKNTGEDESMRKAEVIEAFQFFEEAQAQVPMAGIYLRSLNEVLLKQKVKLLNKPTIAENLKNKIEDNIAPGNSMLRDTTEQVGGLADTAWGPQQDLDYNSDLGELWKEYVDLSPNPDSMPGWDDLFSNLDVF